MANRKKPRTTTDAVEILHRRDIEGKPEMEAVLEEEGKAEVARLVYDLRAQAGLTQKELAQRVGTTASVISRLEDADYNGHSLTMLRRIAATGISVLFEYGLISRCVGQSNFIVVAKSWINQRCCLFLDILQYPCLLL